MTDADYPGLLVNCTVELSNANGIRIAFARWAYRDGLKVRVKADDADEFQVGTLFELVSSMAPIGPLCASARVASVEFRRDHDDRLVVWAFLLFVNFDDHDLIALDSRLSEWLPLVVSYGLDTGLDESTCRRCQLRVASDTDDLIVQISKRDVSVLLLGPMLKATEAHDILLKCHRQVPDSLTANIVICDEKNLPLFQDCIDEDRVFYISQFPLSPSQLSSLVASAMRSSDASLNALEANASTERILELCLRLTSQSEVADVGGLLVEATREMIAVDHVNYFIYDSVKQVLWNRDKVAIRSDSVASGLAGYVARTGQSVHIQKCQEDPRYDGSTDNPGHTPIWHFLAEPILGMEGAVLGVITAARTQRMTSFSRTDVTIIRLLARYAGSSLETISLEDRVQAFIFERTRPHGSSDMFRQEALDHSSRGWDNEGSPLHLSPRWLSAAHYLSIVLLLGSLLYALVAHIDEYASGPAVVAARNKTVIVAARGGIVRSVDAAEGGIVKRGDLLVSLDLPTKDFAGTDKEQIYAPEDGIVNAFRVRPGQKVDAGERVGSIVAQNTGYDLIAFIPDRYAPQIHNSMKLELKLDGYTQTNVLTSIDHVGAETVGPSEALKYADIQSTGILPVAGPVVIVTSHLLTPTFNTGEHFYSYHDGMIGQTQLAISSEPILVVLIPGLRSALRNLGY